ncbi:MAG TPA: RdgB/HAM1 family non-canonical purine NTP pyrophosphatase [Candidatus Dormibacteraeota bacterium]|nr:RdgB/HAM1 family non-canonical purine NTP pyrophosphatase [Candidatus Dormibacteraeota bacterium]
MSRLGATGPRTVVLATRNPGKVEELARLLERLPWRIVALDQVPGGSAIEWDECGATYRHNAEIKARAVLQGTGLPALADDSGLELEALGGWPGVLTARWMGDDASPRQLLRGIANKVEKLPENERFANFVCALAFAEPTAGEEAAVIGAEGRVRGVLLSSPRGDGGFGYDPIFVPEGDHRTMAEMALEEKDRISHRGKAAASLAALVWATPDR